MRNTLPEMGCITNDMPASLWLFLMQKRKTTRVEDKAYALVGLLKFDFHTSLEKDNEYRAGSLNGSRYRTTLYHG
jgi:hypothetical protein